MVVIRESVHPNSLNFANQRKVVILRDTKKKGNKKLPWPDIAKLVRNLKGKHPSPFLVAKVSRELRLMIELWAWCMLLGGGSFGVREEFDCTVFGENLERGRTEIVDARCGVQLWWVTRGRRGRARNMLAVCWWCWSRVFGWPLGVP